MAHIPRGTIFRLHACFGGCWLTSRLGSIQDGKFWCDSLDTVIWSHFVSSSLLTISVQVSWLCPSSEQFKQILRPLNLTRGNH